MRTYSHAIIAAAIAKKMKLKRDIRIAFVFASILPDLPLFLLTGSIMMTSLSLEETMQRMQSNYETNPLWITLHNIPHSLIVLGVLFILLVFLLSKYRELNWLHIALWGVAGATLHTVIDIFTHSGDGPLFLFPLSWSIRFDSPVSYWDPKHFGRTFSGIEYLVDIALLIYILYLPLKQLFSKKNIS